MPPTGSVCREDTRPAGDSRPRGGAGASRDFITKLRTVLHLRTSGLFISGVFHVTFSGRGCPCVGPGNLAWGAQRARCRQTRGPAAQAQATSRCVSMTQQKLSTHAPGPASCAPAPRPAAGVSAAAGCVGRGACRLLTPPEVGSACARHSGSLTTETPFETPDLRHQGSLKPRCQHHAGGTDQRTSLPCGPVLRSQVSLRLYPYATEDEKSASS